MSKPCRRPARAAIQELRSEKKRQEKALNAKLRATGQVPHSAASLPNRGSALATVDEEQEAREDAVSKQMRLLRKELPTLLARREPIPDPRDPRKRRHKLTSLLLYGLLMFVFPFSSRRETHRELSRPQFMANLQLLFPEIDTLPHTDTLFRLLRDIDLDHLEQAHIDLVKPIRLLLDGLYANGPVMQCCRDYHWPFMIVLKNQDLSTVWQEFRALHVLKPQALQRCWGRRQQHFTWVNDIDYAFGSNGRPHLKLHVVVCEESWARIDEQARTVTETSRHAWLSRQPLSQDHVHERCNLGARHRWGIKAGFLVEKHQGYHYEHAFALDWNAMQGDHLLMRLAHGFNTLARFTRQLRRLYQELGVRGAIAFIRNSCAAPWLDPVRMRVLLAEPFLLQLE